MCTHRHTALGTGFEFAVSGRLYCVLSLPNLWTNSLSPHTEGVGIQIQTGMWDFEDALLVPQRFPKAPGVSCQTKQGGPGVRRSPSVSAVLNKPSSSRPVPVLSPPQTTEKPWGELSGERKQQTNRRLGRHTLLPGDLGRGCCSGNQDGV